MRKAENRDNNRGERNAREKAGNVLKNSEVIAVRTCFSLFHARCPLRQRVRDCPRSGIKRKTERSGAWYVGGSEGRGKKVWGKEEDKVANRRSKNRKEERYGGSRNSLGSLPSGLVLARSCPFTTFSFFRAFFFFFLSYCRFKHSFKQGRAAPPCFSSSACTPTALYACKATFACSDRKKGKKEKRDG